MEPIIWRAAVAVAVSYLVGSVNPASMIARLRGVDIFAEGSGNPGATNAGRVLGTGFGVVVALLDIAKGLVPTLLFSQFWGDVMGHVAGLAAVLGHVTSPFLKGRGGKGVATALGAVIAVDIHWVLPSLGVFGLALLATRRMGIASVFAFMSLPVIAFLTDAPPHDMAFALALMAIIVTRHQSNVKAWMSSLRRRSGGGSGP